MEWQRPFGGLVGLDVDSFRLVVFRENEFQDRKLLFDSNGNGNGANKSKSPDVQTRETAAQTKQAKEFADKIFGALPFCNLNECFRVHRVSGSTWLWSLMFKLKRKEWRGSDHSWHSSVSSHIGSFNSTKSSVRSGDSGVFTFLADDHTSSSNRVEPQVKHEPQNQSNTTPEVVVTHSSETAIASPHLSTTGCPSSGTTTTPFSFSVPLASISTESFPNSRTSTSWLHPSSWSHKSPGKRKSVTLGIGLLIRLLDGSSAELTQHLKDVIEDVLGHVKKACHHAIINRQSFNRTMLEAFCEIKSKIADFTGTECLTKPDWHLLLSKRVPNEASTLASEVPKHFFREFLELRDQFDKKKTGFFLSSLLTGLLTHHLGWVHAFMDETTAETKASEVIHHDAQIVITADNDALLRRLIFVLSYFVRCRPVARLQLSEEANKSHQNIKIKVQPGRKDQEKRRPDDGETMERLPPSFGVSFMVGDGDVDAKGTEKCVGDDKNCTDINQQIGFVEMNWLSKPKGCMKCSLNRNYGRIGLSREAFLVPGFQLQCNLADFSNTEKNDHSEWRCNFRRRIYVDLESKTTTIRRAEDRVWIWGDCTSHDVEALSIKSKAIASEEQGKETLVCFSPLVADIVDSVAAVALMSAPHDAVNYLEKCLYNLYKQSKAFALHLMHAPAFTNLKTMASDLGFEQNDVPLLMAAASVHTPEIHQRYGLSFMT